MNNPVLAENKRFGNYLRRLREMRKLSLEAVAVMSARYPARISKSHLSRIENGQALPDFPRLHTLSRMYGVPLSTITEHLQTDFECEPGSVAIQLTDAEVRERCLELIVAGRYDLAYPLSRAALERYPMSNHRRGEPLAWLRLAAITCLLHLRRYLQAKDEASYLLTFSNLNPTDRANALLAYAIACLRRGELEAAAATLREVEAAKATFDATSLIPAHATLTRASLCEAAGMLEMAAKTFSEAAHACDSRGSVFEATRCRINLAHILVRRERYREARTIAVAATRVAHLNGYGWLEALGLSHLAAIAFKTGALEKAVTYALKSNILARPREHVRVVFRNCYYLWRVGIQLGDHVLASLNEKALRLHLGYLGDDLIEAWQFRTSFFGRVSGGVPSGSVPSFVEKGNGVTSC